MGKVLMGNTSHEGNVSMLTPEQQQLFSQTIGQLGPDFMSSLGQFMQPQGVGDYQELFQQSYIDPAMQAMQTQILPQIQQRFTDANAGSSSALNQALSQSATDLSTALGSQFGQFMQGQQQNQLNALGMFGNMANQQTFSPLIQQQQGLAGPLIGAAGKAGAAAMMSSKKVKENIRDYTKSLETVRNLSVKQYDYKEEVGGQKDRVGFIAEELPEELTLDKDGILHADLYGLIGLAMNTIKVLDSRVKELEEAI